MPDEHADEYMNMRSTARPPFTHIGMCGKPGTGRSTAGGSADGPRRSWSAIGLRQAAWLSIICRRSPMALSGAGDGRLA
jgi:hypothetical protein